MGQRGVSLIFLLFPSPVNTKGPLLKFLFFWQVEKYCQTNGAFIIYLNFFYQICFLSIPKFWPFVWPKRQKSSRSFTFFYLTENFDKFWPYPRILTFFLQVKKKLPYWSLTLKYYTCYYSLRSACFIYN